jgi:APA family basic amino acid/polyamine antiporter
MSGALAFAELGAMYPQAGGQYVYIREAYGSWAGFFYGWGFFWFIICGSVAALAVAFVEYLGYFLPALSTQSLLFRTHIFGLSYTLSTGQLVAVAAILILTGINCLGIKSGIIVQNIFTFLRLASVAGIIILGLLIGKKSGALNLKQVIPAGMDLNWNTISMFGLALIAVFWTYDGWYSVNCTAEEIKKPERNIPLGLILGSLIIILCYCLVNLVYIMALPVDEMKGVTRIGELASTRLFGSSMTSVISAAIMVSIFGCLSATILYGPRVYYAMAEDKSFFKSMAYIHPRYRVPTKSLIGQAIWSIVLCLSGTYQDLYEFVVFALVIFFAATGLAVIVLRLKTQTWHDPTRPGDIP